MCPFFVPFLSSHHQKFIDWIHIPPVGRIHLGNLLKNRGGGGGSLLTPLSLLKRRRRENSFFKRGGGGLRLFFTSLSRRALKRGEMGLEWWCFSLANKRKRCILNFFLLSSVSAIVSVLSRFIKPIKRKERVGRGLWKKKIGLTDPFASTLYRLCFAKRAF